MSGAHENATWLGGNRENVTGLDDVLRLGVACDGDLNGACSVLRRDACSDAGGGFDGDGKGGAVSALVVARHLGEANLLAAGFGQRQADEPACMRNHEVDRFRRDVFGSDDDIAFVFPIFFVNQNDHAPGAHFGDDFFDRRNGCGLALRCHGFKPPWYPD